MGWCGGVSGGVGVFGGGCARVAGWVARFWLFRPGFRGLGCRVRRRRCGCPVAGCSVAGLGVGADGVCWPSWSVCSGQVCCLCAPAAPGRRVVGCEDGLGGFVGAGAPAGAETAVGVGGNSDAAGALPAAVLTAWPVGTQAVPDRVPVRARCSACLAGRVRSFAQAHDGGHGDGHPRRAVGLLALPDDPTDPLYQHSQPARARPFPIRRSPNASPPASATNRRQASAGPSTGRHTPTADRPPHTNKATAHPTTPHARPRPRPTHDTHPSPSQNPSDP